MTIRSLNVLKQCLANKGFDDAVQSAIIERGGVKVFGKRVQLTMAEQDVPAVGFMVIEAQI